MKILVTGGCGFIGSFVVDSYIGHGHDVFVIDDLSTGNTKNKNEKARLYVNDILDKDIEDIFKEERPDVVNHHAAQISVPLSVENPVKDLEINIKGTVKLLELSVKYGVKRFIFASTGGAIYGEIEKDPADEEFVPKPLSPYAVSKLSAEKYIHVFYHHFGLPYVILRYSNVYGPRQIPHGEAGVVAIFTESLLKGTRPTLYHFDGEPEGMVRDYVFVEDVARANLMALNFNGTSIFNIGTGKGTLTLDLYRTILEALRERLISMDRTFDEPKRASARPGDIRKSVLNIERAQNLLGWTPLWDLKKGIKKTIEWYIKG